MGFAASDQNLYRFVGNHPTNATDPSGLDEVVPPPRPVTNIAPEPKAVSAGEDSPPDLRDTYAPSTTYNGKLYQVLGKPSWDPVSVGTGKEGVFTNRTVFRNQRVTALDGKTCVGDVEITINGTRRFPEKTLNLVGDHVAYVIIQIRFTNVKCTDAKGTTTEAPDQWKQIGFSLNHSVFLHGQQPPSLDVESRKFARKPGETWEEFVDRYITMARLIKEPMAK